MNINIEKYKTIIEDLKLLPDENVREKNIRMAGVISEIIVGVGGNQPIVVGGLSVDIYTDGGYSTQDIDMMALIDDNVIEILEEIGFERVKGRHYENEDLKVYVEFPTLPFAGDPKLTIDMKTEDGFPLKVIGIGDILADRIRAVINWNEIHQIEWIREILLRHTDRIDLDYVRSVLEIEKERLFLDRIVEAYVADGEESKGISRRFEFELDILYQSDDGRRIFYHVNEKEDTMMDFPGPSSFTDDEIHGEKFGITFYPIFNVFIYNMDTEKYNSIVENPINGTSLEKAVGFLKSLKNRDLELGTNTNNYDSLIELLQTFSTEY